MTSDLCSEIVVEELGTGSADPDVQAAAADARKALERLPTLVRRSRGEGAE